MLLLRVSGSRVGVALHQEERRLTVLTDGTTLPYAATTGAVIWSRCSAAWRSTAPHCELTDWLMAQVTLCCYYGCRDLESVLRCIKNKGASLWVNWLIDGSGYAMLLLRVPVMESVLRCIRKNGTSLCLTDWSTAGYTMLLLRVPGSGVGAALHQEEQHLTLFNWLIDCGLHYVATTGAGIWIWLVLSCHGSHAVCLTDWFMA